MAAGLYDVLGDIGLADDMRRMFDQRRRDSNHRLSDLKRGLGKVPAILQYPELCIYVAGSYARGEASPHSDIDLFFVHHDTSGAVLADPHLKGIRVMAGVIREIEDEQELPPPSNDGQFFNIIRLSKMCEHLGGPEDDHQNFFTARMLLLLESTSVYGADTFDRIMDEIVESYLRDYEDHAEAFRPTFLVNDVLRFWKTLCLNYEHKRNQKEESKKIKQKIRNFKLGHSRLMTCFATVALMSSYNVMDKEDIIQICRQKPLDRLLSLHQRKRNIGSSLKELLQLYHWFLEKTALPVDDLERYFFERTNREEAFGNARRFGDTMYSIVRTVADDTGTLRYLVI